MFISQHFFNNGLTANTRSTYSTDQQQFKAFCQAINASTLPASPATLTLFITHLATKNIFYKTIKVLSLSSTLHAYLSKHIKVYLSAVHHMHISASMFSDFSQQLTPRLQLTRKGIQQSQALSHPSPLESAYQSHDDYCRTSIHNYHSSLTATTAS